MKRIFLSALMTLFLLFPMHVRGDMMLRQYNASKHYRFYSGSDRAFIGAAYDFSGVGYGSSGHWATLVTDNYFVSAYHYHPDTGETVTFWDTNVYAGPKYTYTVTGGTRIGTTDLWVGWFNTPVNTAIERYPILLFPTYYDYFDDVLYNYGLSHRIGRNVVEFFYTKTGDGTSTGVAAWYDFDNNDIPSIGADETYLQSGDSGAPSFAIFDSSLALLGVHWGTMTLDSTAYSIDTFIPVYYNQINTVLAGRGQSLVSVPEPSLFWYLLVASLALWFRFRGLTSVNYFEDHSR